MFDANSAMRLRALLPLPGGERVGVRGQGSMLVQCTEDRLYDTVSISQHIVVPESQYGVPGRFQDFAASFVFSSSFGMLAAIQFHDQSRVRTNEVDPVLMHRRLPSKLPSSKTPIAQAKPEHTLGIGLIPPQPSRCSNASFHGP